MVPSRSVQRLGGEVDQALREVPRTKARSHEVEGEGSAPNSAAFLRAFASSRETDYLPRLRRKFEERHGGDHPLRLAFDKLQTLDTIRVIEDKA